MSVPFPNDYTLRLVAESDAKACAICYRPCTHVLVNTNQADFLYTCHSHLKDLQFVTPVPLPEYTELKSKKEALQLKVVLLTKEKELNKPYVWNKISNYWLGDKNEKKEGDKDDKLPTDKYQSIVKDLEATNTELLQVSKQMDEYKFKQFTLHQQFYKSRVNNYVNAKVTKLKVEKMKKEGFFPSAPTNKLG